MRLKQANETIELTVRDTGVGIAAAELPRLFERFYRIEGVHGRTYEGSGIGLALVQELVKLHGGAVRVESQPGQGSAFIVTLPRGFAHLPAEQLGGQRTLNSTATSARAYVEEALRWLPSTTGEWDRQRNGTSWGGGVGTKGTGQGQARRQVPSSFPRHLPTLNRRAFCLPMTMRTCAHTCSVCWAKDLKSRLLPMARPHSRRRASGRPIWC